MTYDYQLCECGHGKAVHAMDHRTHQLSGHCYMFQSPHLAQPQCKCEKYRPAPKAY